MVVALDDEHGTVGEQRPGLLLGGGVELVGPGVPGWRQQL